MGCLLCRVELVRVQRFLHVMSECWTVGCRQTYRKQAEASLLRNTFLRVYEDTA